jgi:hypothetical protein
MKNKYFKIFLLALSLIFLLKEKGYASSIPSHFSVNMQIPSWYRRNDALITRTNNVINVLLAYFGTQEELPRRAKIETGIRAMLANERDWPSAVIAFKERGEVIDVKYNEAIKTGEKLPLHQANKEDFAKIKEQFGIK